ncbi:MAG: glutamate--tRNA ligase [Mollicutes bacterium PWAP]|nr:glutamate--tRNA ligase [Mollicutes bacterium PWAP]
MNKKRIRTRYAPSPTGYLHIGGARSALFGYLFAKKNNGDFVVRTEDTDISRNVKDGENSQIKNLIWLGIIPDESALNPNPKYKTYRQSEKLERYDFLINEMIEKGDAYYAYDTKEELEEQHKYFEEQGVASFRYKRNWLKISEKEKEKRHNSKEYSIRIALKKNNWYSWKDIVRGKISINTDDIGDFVIRKQDGYPTYNFAVVVDDYDMEMTHVFRGEEHISNTPKQLAIYDSFGWEAPEFGHLTIITNMDGKKLSKRDLETKQFIEQYKGEGYYSHAIFNFLTLLGWTHPQAKEVMEKKEIIDSFDPKRLSKSSSKFNMDKMNWFSKEYIQNMEYSNLKKFINLNINKEEEWKKIFIETFKKGSVTFKELEKKLNIYKNPLKGKKTFNEVVKKFSQILSNKEWTIENIQESINETKIITGVKGKKLFMPIRLATTFEEHGPELHKAIWLFGKEIIMDRLNV